MQHAAQAAAVAPAAPMAAPIPRFFLVNSIRSSFLYPPQDTCDKGKTSSNFRCKDFLKAKEMPPHLTIGALSAQTGCNVPTIRYYEEIGLLPPPQRTASGHRSYRDADLKRLAFIKRCRDFGFPIERVRTLANLFEDGDRPCAEARDMAQEQLAAVRVKLEELRALEASLMAFVDGCDAVCSGGVARDCVIIEDLSMPEVPEAGASSSCCDTASKKMPPQITATELKRR